jgi:hypothetical protein
MNKINAIQPLVIKKAPYGAFFITKFKEKGGPNVHA